MRWGSPLLVALVVAAHAFPGGRQPRPPGCRRSPYRPPARRTSGRPLAVGADGTVIAVWQRATCTQLASRRNAKTAGSCTRHDRPGGNFSTPAPIPGDPEPGQLTLPPSVAFDGAGNAIAVWTSGIGMASRVRYSSGRAAASSGPRSRRQRRRRSFVRFPDVAMAPSGRGGRRFQRTSKGKLASVLGPAPRRELRAGETDGRRPGRRKISTRRRRQHRLRPVKRHRALGQHRTGTNHGDGCPLRSPSGRRLSIRTETVEPGRHAAASAMAPPGAAVMVWRPPGAPTEVRYAFRAPGGPFGAPSVASPIPTTPEPRVVIAADGSAVAAWTAEPDSSAVVHWSASPPGGPFGPRPRCPRAGPARRWWTSPAAIRARRWHSGSTTPPQPLPSS